MLSILLDRLYIHEHIISCSQSGRNNTSYPLLPITIIIQFTRKERGGKVLTEPKVGDIRLSMDVGQLLCLYIEATRGNSRLDSSIHSSDQL